MTSALVTVTDNNYVLYTKVLLQSLYQVKMTDRIYIIQSGLEHSHREACLKLYPNIIFVDADAAFYNGKGKDLVKFYKFEMFKIREYDKLIFIDSDIILLKPLSGLIDEEMAKSKIAMMREGHRACYNSGLIVIDKELLTDEIYMSLVNYPWSEAEFGKDQQVFNKKFDGMVHRIDAKYNWFANEMPPAIQEIVGLHYINKNFTEIDKKRVPQSLHEIWFNIYNEMRRRLKCE